MYACNVCMYVGLSVCMYVCMHVCMYPCTSPWLPSISRKIHGFSSVFAKRMSKNTEFCQIFGKRMQEAQASKKAGRGNRAWDPCFATPAPRRLRLVERHQIAARYVGDPPPPPPKTYVIDVGRGRVRPTQDHPSIQTSSRHTNLLHKFSQIFFKI